MFTDYPVKVCPKCGIEFNLCEMQVIDSAISEGAELACFKCGEILVIGLTGV